MPSPPYLVASPVTESFIYKLLGGLDEVYVGASVYCSPELIAGARAGATQDFFELFDLYGAAGGTPTVAPAGWEAAGHYDGIYLNRCSSPPPASLWSPEFDRNIDAGEIAAGWHEIDLHLKLSTDTAEWLIDGVTYDRSGDGNYPGWMSQVDAVAFGSIFAGGGQAPAYMTNLRVGTSGFGSTDIIAEAFASDDFSAWDGTRGLVTLAGQLPTTSGRRFYEPPEWKWALAKLDTLQIISYIERVATSKTVTRTLNAAWTAAGDAPSNHPLICTPRDDDDDTDPFLEAGSRALLGFRYESSSEPKYTIRYAGIVMQVQDQAQGGTARTTFTAFDPRKLLEARPCVLDTGKPIPAAGITHTALRVDELALKYLANTIATHGPVFIDAGGGAGGTGFHTGTLEAIGDAITYTIQQGTSVAQLWDDLNQLGLCDIKLTPIYDWANRPGYLSDLSIVEEQGVDKDGAVFAWDLLPQTLAAITRLTDRTPDKLANRIEFYADGLPVEVQEDTDSEDAYGVFVAQQFFTQDQKAAVEAFAAASLLIRKDGQTIVSISPTPERAPAPITGYDVGDRVPVYASRNLRKPLSGRVRVYGIPIQIQDDTSEVIAQLLVSADGSP